MSLTVDLSAEAEERLREEARRQGVNEVELVRRLIEREFRTAAVSPGRHAAIAAELTLRKIWDTPEEDEAWRDL